MRGGWLFVCIALIALIPAAPTVTWAADAHADNHALNAGQEEQKAVNRDLFQPALDLGIWSLVIFLVLLFVLGKFAWKPMMQGLEHREKAIHAALHEAQQAREETARLRGQLEEQLRKANDQARQMLDEARRAAERTTAEMTAEAHKKIQADYDRLHREMSLEYDQAKRDIETQVSKLATLVAGKVIRRQLNHDDHRQLVDEALAELQQAGNGRRQTTTA